MEGRFDLVILGGGSAGFAAALKAVEMGKEVAICESAVIGGTCLNRGCIPSKNLLRAAEIFHYSKSQPFRGIELLPGGVDLGALVEQKDEIIEELRKEKYINILLNNKKIHYFEGRASFVSPAEVRVGEHLLSSERFIVATGARPQVVPFSGIEGVDFLDSTRALELKELPPSMVILGGRFVAVEMAQIFSRLGTEVTILQRSPVLIPDEEEVVSLGLAELLKEEGIEVRTGVRVREILKRGEEKVVRAVVGDKAEEFSAGALLLATGIAPNTEGLGLEKAGVETDARGFVKTDEFMRTTNPSIYAAGDVAGTIALVTVAAHEGSVAARNIFAEDECCLESVDYSVVPHAIFTQPNVASVGLKEGEAEEKGTRVVSRTLDMRHVPRARAVMEARGLIKMVAEEKTERILGVHILGPQGAEVIHQAVLLVKHGMTLRDATEKIDVYPTFSEMIKLCGQSFYRDVSGLSCCAE